jgi:hypothetical protein
MADEIRRHGPGVLIVMVGKQDRLRGCFFGNTWRRFPSAKPMNDSVWHGG